MPPYAATRRQKTPPRNCSPEATCATAPCIGQCSQRVSRSREKVPRNPYLRPRPERETAGQAPVPYAQGAPTSVFSGGGGSIGSLAARTSASAKVLVVRPCIRSRLGAVLLSIGDSSPESRETLHRRRPSRPSGYVPGRRRSGRSPRETAAGPDLGTLLGGENRFRPSMRDRLATPTASPRWVIVLSTVERSPPADTHAVVHSGG
jgi:hypothetical protein